MATMSIVISETRESPSKRKSQGKKWLYLHRRMVTKKNIMYSVCSSSTYILQLLILKRTRGTKLY